MITCPTGSALVHPDRAARPVRRHRTPTAAPRRVDDRVYRRRRTVAGVLLAGVVAASAVAIPEVLAGPGGVPASATGSQPTLTRITVVAQPGDTLWEIARRHHGPIDFDRYLDALVDLNGGPAIQAGQAVLLP